MLAALRSRRAVVWLAVVTIVAGVLAFVPLFDVLGFELSFVVAFVVSFGAADLAATHVRRARPEAVWAAFAGAAPLGLALTVPPLVVVTLNALRVPACDPLHGLGFYLLLPVCSALCATTAGVVCGFVLGRWGWAAAIAPWLVVVASIVVGVWRFYAGPPLFGYDPFVGYFPGSMYDEELGIPAALLWARLYHGALCVFALAGVDAVRRRRVTSAALAAAAAAGAWLLFARSADLGFRVDAGDIAAALGGRRDTAHFTIVYPRGATFEPDLEVIAREHELRYRQVAQAFGVDPDLHITSFYFASDDEKARWMGAKNADVAKPWRREIYLSHEQLPHGSMRHEIAHVFAGSFGDPLFGVAVAWWGWPPARVNVGLIEGAAVAADWPTQGRLTPHESAKAMLALGYLPPLRTVMAPTFFSFSPARSYQTAGSFCRFLLDRYGGDRFRALYRSGGRPGDYPAIFGKQLDALDAEWRASLDAVPVPDEEVAIARERFRRRGIFSRPCPHAIARRRAAAAALVAAGRPDEALPYVMATCREEPDEPGHQLDLAETLARAGRLDEAAALLGTVGRDDGHSDPLRARALLALVDLEARRGRRAEAQAALALALPLRVEESMRRNLMLRGRALGSSVEAPAIAGYVFARGRDGNEPDAVLRLARTRALEESAPALARYLQGRILAGAGAHADAAAALADAARLGLDDPLLARENDRLLVGAAYLAGDLATAGAAAARLAAEDQPAAVRRLAADWLARLQYARDFGAK